MQHNTKKPNVGAGRQNHHLKISDLDLLMDRFKSFCSCWTRFSASWYNCEVFRCSSSVVVRSISDSFTYESLMMSMLWYYAYITLTYACYYLVLTLIVAWFNISCQAWSNVLPSVFKPSSARKTISLAAVWAEFALSNFTAAFWVSSSACINAYKIK